MSTLIDISRGEDENVEDFIFRVCKSKDSLDNWDDVINTIKCNIDNPIDNTFSLYAHQNKTNGKLYIGITGRDCKLRWKSGNGYKTQHRFWRAIRKYGWKNFDHFIICDCLDKQSAMNLEVKLIELFKTREENFGYNCSLGGDLTTLGYHNAEGLSIPIYQYSIDGKFLAEFPSMMEAERATGIENSAICACCKGRHAYTKGFRWSYEKHDALPYLDKKAHRFELVTKAQQKPVYQYGLDGFFIAEYPSLMTAAKSTGYSFKTISQCCLGAIMQYKGYIWRYEFSESVPPVLPRYIRMIETRQNNRIKKNNGVTECA